MSDIEPHKVVIDNAEIVHTTDGVFLEIEGRANSQQAADEFPKLLNQLGFGEVTSEKPRSRGKSFSMAGLGERYDQIFRRKNAANN